MAMNNDIRHSTNCPNAKAYGHSDLCCSVDCPRRCTCEYFWHNPTDHDAKCPVAQCARILTGAEGLDQQTKGQPAMREAIALSNGVTVDPERDFTSPSEALESAHFHEDNRCCHCGMEDHHE